MKKNNIKFMRVFFVALAISSLTLGLLDIVNIRGQAIASVVLLSLLLFVELFDLKKNK